MEEKKIDSNSELERQTGLSNGTIAKWQKGVTTPTIKSLQKLADFFGVTIDFLLGDSDIRKPVQSPPEDEEEISLTPSLLLSMAKQAS